MTLLKAGVRSAGEGGSGTREARGAATAEEEVAATEEAAAGQLVSSPASFSPHGD